MLSAEAVRAVLARHEQDDRYWAIRWQYAQGTGFYDELCRCVAHADAQNAARLAHGFPELVAGVLKWKDVPGWAQEVEAWAESLVANGAP